MTSHPEFTLGTKGSEVARVFSDSIDNKIVVITGVSPKSLGETLATIVAQHRPSILVLASRTLPKLQAVADSIISAAPIKPTVLELDLSSQSSIRKAAESVKRSVCHIDILINNAAVVSTTRCETVEGIEQTFGTNHIGHFLWTSLLTPLLLAAPGGSRVVNVTSLGYRLSPIRFHDYNFKGKDVPPEEEPPAGVPTHLNPSKAERRPYQAFCAYGQSKTANILHCVSLNQKYASNGLRAFAVHPGSIWTELSRNLSPSDLAVIEGTSTTWIDQDQGTATILVAALDPNLEHVKDQVLLSECQFIEAAKSATDETIAERLWELSEKLAGGGNEVKRY